MDTNHYKNEKTYILVFFLLGFMLLSLINDVLVPNWNYTNDVSNSTFSINGYKSLSDIDVAFLGTSHMKYSISPMQLYKDNSIRSYNFATIQQPIDVSYNIADEAVHKFHPKVLILEVSGLFIIDSQEKSYRYVLDSMQGIRKGKIITSYYEHYKNDEDIFKQIFGMIVPFYKYHTRWDELSKADMLPANDKEYFLFGAYLSPYISPSQDKSIEEINRIGEMISQNKKYYYSSTDEEIENFQQDEHNKYIMKIPEKNKSILIDIKKICDENGCNLVLYKAPVYANGADYRSSWTYAKRNEVLKMASRLDTPFLDLQYDANVVFDYEHDTCEYGSHLNYLGARKATAYVGKWLESNYQFECSKDTAYDSKLKLYNKNCEIADIEMQYDLPIYLDTLKKQNLCIFISIRDDMSEGLNALEIDALNGLGLKNDFKEIKYNYSFIGVLDCGTPIYECMSNRFQEYKTKIDNTTVEIISAGYLDGNTSSIKIDGNEYSMNSRGINIVVFDKESGMVIDRASCDTWAPKHEVIHENGSFLFKYQEYLLEK